MFEWAQAQGAIVITFDEDFADQRSFPVGTHCGVVRLRVWPTTIEVVREALERLLDTISSDAELAGALVVISQSQVRIRRGSGPEAA